LVRILFTYGYSHCLCLLLAAGFLLYLVAVDASSRTTGFVLRNSGLEFTSE